MLGRCGEDMLKCRIAASEKQQLSERFIKIVPLSASWKGETYTILTIY